jgi:MiaB/RimO family radical SAM methylthiotransferase
MKFYIETYGCTANFGNSSETEVALMEMGHQPSLADEAEIIIVNTCAVTEKTERKILRRLRQLQGSRLVIAGCLATALPTALEDIECRKIVGLLGRSAAEEVAGLFEDNCALFRQSNDLSFRQDACGIVNIAEGCTGQCSYCVVRKARGSLISREPEDVVDAVSRLVASGSVEIQLAAQDTAAYGVDIGTNLAELLMKVNDIPGKFMIRVGMMNPDTVLPILDELIRAFQIPRVFKFIHIPVQSGSDRILRSMHRRYSSEEFLNIIDAFRRVYLSIRT